MGARVDTSRMKWFTGGHQEHRAVDGGPQLSSGEQGHAQNRTKGAPSPKECWLLTAPGGQKPIQIPKGPEALGVARGGILCISAWGDLQRPSLCPPTNTLQIASEMVVKTLGFPQGTEAERE